MAVTISFQRRRDACPPGIATANPKRQIFYVDQYVIASDASPLALCLTNSLTHVFVTFMQQGLEKGAFRRISGIC
jgi:hypothetical protein